MNLLAKIDVLGTPATLNFFGNHKKKSNFGGICSLLFFGFLAWTIYNSSRDLFSRSDPKIVLSEINVEDPREISISNQEFPIGFIIQNPTSLGNAGFSNESIYTVQLQYQILERVQQPDGKIVKQWTITNLEVEKCTKEYFGKYASSFATFTFKGSYCISQNQPGLENLKLRGIYSSTIYKSLVVQILQCNPDTSNVTCGTPQEISQYLSGSRFSALYLDNTMNIQDYKNPTGKYRELYSTLMNPATYKEVDINIGYLEVATDSGWITETQSSSSSLKVDKINELVNYNASSDKTLLYCTFQASRLETHYYRSYKKIQTALAEVGGLANVALAILLFLTTPYLRLKSREALMDEMFDVKKQPSTKKSRKNPLNKDIRDQSNNNKVLKQSVKEPPQLIDKKLRLNILTSSFASELSPFKSFVSPRDTPKTQRMETTEKTDKLIRNLPSANQLVLTNEFVISSGTRFDQKENRIEPIHQFGNPSTSRSETPILPKDDIKSVLQFSTRHQPTMADGDKFYPEESFSCEVEEKGKTIRKNADWQDKTYDDEEAKDYKNRNMNDEDGKSQNDGVKGDIEMEINSQTQEQHREEYNNKTERNNEEVKTTELKFWEYLLSLVYKPNSIKTKLALIEEGVKTIDIRLDLSSLLKKFSEVDKLISLLLDRDQLELFNNMPKPAIKLLNPNGLLRSTTYEDNLQRKTIISSPSLTENKDQTVECYERLKEKRNKNEIDKRLINIFSQRFEQDAL